jgi:tetratricopeptide (TPR) repeat protein
MKTNLRQHFIENWKFILLIIILCVGAYLNTLDNAFVSDDIQGILNNPQLGNLAIDLKKFDLNVLLKDLVFFVFGRSPLAYHALNISLHTLATMLVYFFVLIVTEKKRVAMFSTLIFALHPIHTETVAWISGRGYALYSIFFFLSFILYDLYLENENRTRYAIASAILYAAALFSSTWALPLLIIFPLYGWYLKGKKFHGRFLVVLIAITALNLLLVFKVGGVTSRASRGLSVGGTHDYTITMPHSLTQYVYLLFWPAKLAFYRENDLLTQKYILASRVLASLLLIVLPLVLLIKKKKLALFFLIFFLAAISLSLSPIKVGWYVAERYLYLGTLAFAVFVSYLFVWLEKKTKIQHLAMVMIIPLLGLYGIRTVTRNADWQNRETLWTATIRDSPRSPRAHNNMGSVYGEKGDWKAAEAEFKKALKLKPNYNHAANNLGISLLQLGKLEEAQKAFLLALKLDPNRPSILYNLGLISYQQGKLDEAKAYWQKTLQISPNYRPAQKALRSLENI